MRQKKNNGQIMMLTVVLMGSTLLLASAIAGYVVFSQLKNTQDIARTVQAFFAADAGVEHSLYCYFKEPEGVQLNVSLQESDAEGLDFEKIKQTVSTNGFCERGGMFDNKAIYKTQIFFTSASSTNISLIKIKGFQAYAIGSSDKVGRALESQYFVRN